MCDEEKGYVKGQCRIGFMLKILRNLFPVNFFVFLAANPISLRPPSRPSFCSRVRHSLGGNACPTGLTVFAILIERGERCMSELGYYHVRPFIFWGPRDVSDKDSLYRGEVIYWVKGSVHVLF